MLDCTLKSAGFTRQIALKRVEVADDDLQQIVEIVRHASRQLADSFHFLGLAERLFVLPQLFSALRYLLLQRSVQIDESFLGLLALLDFALHSLREADVVYGNGSFGGKS